MYYRTDGSNKYARSCKNGYHMTSSALCALASASASAPAPAQRLQLWPPVLCSGGYYLPYRTGCPGTWITWISCFF